MKKFYEILPKHISVTYFPITLFEKSSFPFCIDILSFGGVPDPHPMNPDLATSPYVRF